MALIESNTTALLSLALEATTMRQQAIAHNIANANSPNYTPIDVRFDEKFSELRTQLKDGNNTMPVSLDDYRPTFEKAAANSVDAAPVALDREMVKLSENVLHHQALLKMLNKHFTILNMAVTEGKR